MIILRFVFDWLKIGASFFFVQSRRAVKTQITFNTQRKLLHEGYVFDVRNFLHAICYNVLAHQRVSVVHCQSIGARNPKASRESEFFFVPRT